MRSEELKSIEDYESFLDATIKRWSPEQRVALAAAMAERWLPSYETFSAAEQWGDAASLRRSLEAVWAHACGRRLATAERARQLQLLADSTPHMDDFDAYEALAACVILHEALECCGMADNAYLAVRSALSGFEAAVPDWAEEPDNQSRLWKRVAARKELSKQLKLVERIGSLTRIDDEIVKVLRRYIKDAKLVGEISKPAKSTSSSGLTNQAAFEQYRRLLTSHLKQPAWVPPSSGAYMTGISIFSEWGMRYLHRMRTISGKDGRLADVLAQEALVARLWALDAVSSAVPDWEPEIREVMEMCLANPVGEYDVKSLERPHGYGPSLRRLWAEAKRQDLSDGDAWKRVVSWARHHPPAWEAEDRRKRKGLSHTSLELGEKLARKVTWSATGDVDFPWAAEVDGVRWRVGLNDFPDDLMYSLVVGDEMSGSFHDWSRMWHRD